MTDPIHSPPHYTGLPSGVECIDVTEHFNFNRGNAIKYIWRAGRKSNEIEDLEKAAWYIRREVERLKRSSELVDGVRLATVHAPRAGMGTERCSKAVNRGIDEVTRWSLCD